MVAAIAAAMVAAMVASGCAGGAGGGGDGGGEVPIAAMTDRTASVERRLAAIEGARGRFSSDAYDTEALRSTLKSVAWRRADPARVRIAAIDALLADEARLDDTRTMLALMLPTESAWRQWEVIEAVGARAAALGWRDLSSSFVASWSREDPRVPDAERPERRALSRLHPGEPIAEVVLAVLSGRGDGGDGMGVRDRVGAWGLLSRIAPDRGELVGKLAAVSSSGEDPLLEALSACAAEWRCLPGTAEQLEWLLRLRDPSRREAWDAAASAISALDASATGSIELRHGAAIAWAAAWEPAWLGLSRSEHLDALASALDDAERHRRRSASGAAADTLRRHGESMSWADALTVRVALRAMADGSVVAELFRQADVDHLDTSTEHGGVIGASGAGLGGFEALHFPPRPAQRSGDTRFVASEDLLAAATTALFHHHFHVSHRRNAAYAGPSAADIGYARRHGCAALVFTSVDGDRLNVDYYQPDGVELDLGTIRRPAG